MMALLRAHGGGIIEAFIALMALGHMLLVILAHRRPIERKIDGVLAGNFALQITGAILLVGIFRIGARTWYILPAAAWILLTLVVQLYAQVSFAVRSRSINSTRLAATRNALRFSLLTLLWVGLYVGMDKLISASLMASAKALNLADLNREAFLWLRAPLTLFLSSLFQELTAELAFCLQFQTGAPQPADGAEKIHALAGRLGAGQIRVRILKTDAVGISMFRFFGRSPWARRPSIYFTPSLLRKLPQSEWEYLVARLLAEPVLEHRPRRILESVGVLALLTFPYLLLLQFVTYELPEAWMLASWGALYLGLLLGLTRLRRALVFHQVIERNAWACRKLNLKPETVVRAEESLRTLNRVPPRLPLLIELPRGVVGRTDVRPLEQYLEAKNPGLTLRLVKLSLGVGLVLFVIGAFTVLKPRYDLRSSAQNGDLANLSLLLENGADPNRIDVANGMTPILAATRFDRLQAIDLLLTHGADPNLKHIFKLSPLLLAAEKGSLPAVSLLVRKGASVNFQGFKGYSPLMLAAVHDHVEVVRYLLDHGANIDLRSKRGSTAVMLAVQSGAFRSVRLLSSRHAKLWFRDMDGDNVVDLARKKYPSKLVKWMDQEFSRSLASSP